MDTMIGTKIVGAFCGSLLILLLGGWAGELLYHVGGDGHGDHHQAYIIDTGDGAEAEPEAEVPFEEVFAAADAGAGERVFGKCRACHKLEPGANGVGPTLHAIVGRGVGAIGEFRYSGALSAAAEIWTPDALNAFLENPKGYAPGTSMSFNGLPKVEDRANLIAYLETFN